MAASLKSVLGSIDRQAWKHLFLALGGLALAFFAAVYSTVAREAGNVWMTAALASAALLLAGFVGLTTVPFLARRVAFCRVREVIDYDITREGLFYIGLVLVIGVAALNTGNNLLFMLLALMLGAIVVSGIASAAVLRGLELEVMLPEHAFAGRSVQARLTLRNSRRVLPSMSVSIVPPRPEKRRRHLRAERTSFGFPRRHQPEKQWFRLPDFVLRFSKDHRETLPIFSGAVYFPYIGARSSASADLELRFDRRGRYEQAGFGLATRFPFSFLLKTRRIELKQELIVYPSIEATDSSLEVLPLLTGEFESFVRGRGFDLYRIRDYQPEDSRRHVDWKATARTGSLKVREFTREDERKLRVVFDNPAPGTLDEAQYEQSVRVAASMAWHFADESTELSFAAPGFSGPGIYDFLRYLALVQPEADGSLLEQLEVTDDYNLILTARERGSIPTRLWNCSYIVFLNGTRRDEV